MAKSLWGWLKNKGYEGYGARETTRSQDSKELVERDGCLLRSYMVVYLSKWRIIWMVGWAVMIFLLWLHSRVDSAWQGRWRAWWTYHLSLFCGCK